MVNKLDKLVPPKKVVALLRYEPPKNLLLAPPLNSQALIGACFSAFMLCFEKLIFLAFYRTLR